MLKNIHAYIQNVVMLIASTKNNLANQNVKIVTQLYDKEWYDVTTASPLWSMK